MGWLWTSSKPKKPSQAAPAPFADSAPLSPPSSSIPPTLSPSTSTSTSPEPPSPAEKQQSPKSPDSPQQTQQQNQKPKDKQKDYEYADAEFRAFFRELAEAEESASLPHNQPFANSPLKKLFAGRPNASPSPPSTTSTTASTPSLDTATTNNNNNNPLANTAEPPTTLKIHPTNIYATKISCQAAFDAAFYCQSLGGQFNAVYRYGTIRDCAPHWSQFWFCVKTNRRAMSDAERQARVMEWYQAREMKKYKAEGPSSEDVWVQREEMVVGAFTQDYEAANEEGRKRWMKKMGMGMGVGVGVGGGATGGGVD